MNNTIKKINGDILFYILLLLTITYRLTICFSYNPELSVGETNNIWNALSVANGKAIYSNPEETPFEIFQYTPYSQIPIILIAKMFNSESINYYYNVMVFGRLLSLVYNILTFVLVFKLLIEQLKIHKDIAKWTTLFGFCILTHLSFSIRPDAMALLFTTYSLYVFGKAYFNETYKHLILSSILFSFSFYVKQDAPLIISALGLVLIIQKRIKSLIIFSMSFCIALLFISFLNYLIYGEYFFYSILGGINNGMSIKRALDVFERFTHFYGVLFFIGVFSSLYIIKSKESQINKIYLISIFLLSILIAVFSSLKLGSWINYFTFVNISAIITASYFINLFYKTDYEKNILFSLKNLLSIVIVYFLFQQVYHYTSPFLKYSDSKNYHSEVSHQFNLVKDSLDVNGGVVYSNVPEIKLLLFKNIILPNSEFYPVSSFFKDGYNKLDEDEKISLMILDEPYEDCLKGSPFQYYNINTSEFKVIEKRMNFTLLKNGNN